MVLGLTDAQLEEVLKTLGITKEHFDLYVAFHPLASEKVCKGILSKNRFVHYTNAETAMKMFANREVWLRKSANMNDFMEVDHGVNCLINTYKAHKETILASFDGMFPGVCKRIEDYFNGWLPTFRLGTYIACVSEHDDSPQRNEDRMGRLSMWRAYGGTAGVAIVMNGEVFHTPISTDALKAYVSPVAYLDEKGFEKEFVRFLDGVKMQSAQLVARGEDEFFVRVFTAFRYAALCTKHPGFLEEREWRIIYSPAIEKSDVITQNVELIGGIPQMVCKLPLRNHPDLGIVGIELPQLINRVIVGPTLYPFEISEALAVLLENAKVENAVSKVFVSDIPLRHAR